MKDILAKLKTFYARFAGEVNLGALVTVVTTALLNTPDPHFADALQAILTHADTVFPDAVTRPMIVAATEFLLELASVTPKGS